MNRVPRVQSYVELRSPSTLPSHRRVVRVVIRAVKDSDVLCQEMIFRFGVLMPVA